MGEKVQNVHGKTLLVHLVANVQKNCGHLSKMSYRQNFLKYLNNGSFEWLANDIAKSKKLNFKVNTDVSIDELYHGFETKLK